MSALPPRPPGFNRFRAHAPHQPGHDRPRPAGRVRRWRQRYTVLLLAAALGGLLCWAWLRG